MSVASLREQVRAAVEGSIVTRCQAVGLARSSYYYQPRGESAENLRLMRLLDEEYTRHCFLGVRGLQAWLRQQGQVVNRKRVRRLVRLMGLEAVGPKPRLSVPGQVSQRFPYLLREQRAEAINHVWSTDITYIPMAQGFLYLVAVMDWYSRYVLSWELSNTLTVDFCLQALAQAVAQYQRPLIFNSDQGVQFTSTAFVGALQDVGCQISWDGKGRATDNAFIERLWRSVKWECVYLNPAQDGHELYEQLAAYFHYYNHLRPHQGLHGKTPAGIYLPAFKQLPSTIS